MEHLPDEIFVKNIFPYLSLSTKLAIRLVSKRFNILMNDNESMVTLDLEKVSLKLMTLSENANYLNNLNCLHDLRSKYGDIVTDCGNLDVKRLTMVDIYFVEIASSTWPNLRQLILRDVHIDKEWKWLREFKSVEHFELVVSEQSSFAINPILLEAVENWVNLKRFIISAPRCHMSTEMLINLLLYLPCSLTHLQLKFKTEDEANLSDANEEFKTFFSCHENLVAFEYYSDWKGFDFCTIFNYLKQYCPNITFIGYFQRILTSESNMSLFMNLKFAIHLDESEAITVDVLNLSSCITSSHFSSNSTLAESLPNISFANIKELVISGDAWPDNFTPSVNNLTTKLIHLEKLSLPLKYFNSDILIPFVEKCKQLVEIVCLEKVCSPLELTNISKFLNAINRERSIMLWPINVSENHKFKGTNEKQLLVRLCLPWSNDSMKNGPVIALKSVLRNGHSWNTILTRFEKLMIWKSMGKTYLDNFGCAISFDSDSVNKVDRIFTDNEKWSQRKSIFEEDLQEFLHWFWFKQGNFRFENVFYDIMTFSSQSRFKQIFGERKNFQEYINMIRNQENIVLVENNHLSLVYSFFNKNFDKYFCLSFQAVDDFSESSFVRKWIHSFVNKEEPMVLIEENTKSSTEWNSLMERFNSTAFCRFCLRLAIDEEAERCFKDGP